ncbi:hypothetical protein ACFV24_10105 [Nocardia fluminea]|uniref:hypothetical protein n=1 Tax=Nocardia fluminea TaxID=134984 RepID=UPI00366E7B91
MSITLETAILAALKSGSMLTIATIARNVNITEQQARRAAINLQRRDFAFENRRAEWQITPAGRTAAAR